MLSTFRPALTVAGTGHQHHLLIPSKMKSHPETWTWRHEAGYAHVFHLTPKQIDSSALRVLLNCHRLGRDAQSSARMAGSSTSFSSSRMTFAALCSCDGFPRQPSIVAICCAQTVNI